MLSGQNLYTCSQKDMAENSEEKENSLINASDQYKSNNTYSKLLYNI